MKVYVSYDDSGLIRGTLAVSSGRRLSLKPSPGLHLHSFEHAELGPEERRSYLRSLHQDHCVDVAGGGPNVIRRINPKKPR